MYFPPPTLTEIAKRAEAIRRTWNDPDAAGLRPDEIGVILPIDERKLPELPCECRRCGTGLPNGVAAQLCSPCARLVNSGQANVERIHDYLSRHGTATAPEIYRALEMDPSGARRALRRGRDVRFRRVSTKPKHLWEAIQ